MPCSEQYLPSSARRRRPLWVSAINMFMRLHAGQQREFGHQEGGGVPALVQQAVERCALCADEPRGGLPAIRQSTLPCWPTLCLPLDPQPPECCHGGDRGSFHNIRLLRCLSGWPQHRIYSCCNLCLLQDVMVHGRVQLCPQIASVESCNR